MAKRNGLTTFCANTVDENEKLLHETCLKSQVEVSRKKEDLDNLFLKLNHVSETKLNKQDLQYSPTWCNKNVKNYIYGPVSGFPTGSWWGIRMDCSRDRVHDPFDENIQNGPCGVTSICTSGNNLNEDIDRGNALTITGQKYQDDRLDEDPLLRNYENQIPVRLIRSYNLLNEFAPKTGYRYDGLYVVAKFWIGVNADSEKYYKFVLMRLIDQEPPLWHKRQSPLAASDCTSKTCYSHSRNILPDVHDSKRLRSLEAMSPEGKHERSHKYVHLLSTKNKEAEERKTNNSESDIVTRHVFRKEKNNAECTLNTGSISVSSKTKSVVLIGNQQTKAHNTNISVRTGLYNSSPNEQHDSKKNASIPFCRMKTSHNMSNKSNQHMESWNMSNKEKDRAGVGKSDVLERVTYDSSDQLLSKLTKGKLNAGTNEQINGTYDSVSTSWKQDDNITRNEVIENSMEEHNSSQDSVSSPTNMLNITNCMYKNDVSTQMSSHKEVHEIKTFDSLEALTPDKILHLINNKGQALSKLLLGDMIGLTAEQCMALQERDEMNAKAEKKDTKLLKGIDITKDIEQEKNVKTAVEDLNESTVLNCYKFRRRRRLSRRITSKTDVKYNKMHDDKLKKRSVKSSNIFMPHLSFAKCNDFQANTRRPDLCTASRKTMISRNIVRKKKSDKNLEKENGHEMCLRSIKEVDTPSKKHANKKYRREIANLLIDAKIGPKMRGPRYRRLRHISNMFPKQSFERSNATVCKRSDSGSHSECTNVRNKRNLRKISNCKNMSNKQKNDREESHTISSEQHKLNKNLSMLRKIREKGRITRQIVNNGSVDRKENGMAYNGNIDGNDKVSIGNQKRKLSEVTYTRSTKVKLRDASTKEVSGPCKTDAVTQCSLIKEPLTPSLRLNGHVQTNAQSEQHTFIKIEYGNVKSVACKSMKLNNDNKYRTILRPEKTYISHTKEQKSIPSPERVSAFVPVNILDNNLKIARLRSIGFKPINVLGHAGDVNDENDKPRTLQHNAAEKYNKYTNEEDDIVVYMDDELQYQDIENEDKNSLPVRSKTLNSVMCSVNDKQSSKASSEKKSLSEQDLESPWHGWKKVVTSKSTYWIGW